MSLTIEEIAQLTNAHVFGDEAKEIEAVADLESATQKDASFLAPPAHQKMRYEQAMLASKAGVIFVPSEDYVSSGRNFLVVDNPSRAFQTLIEHFAKDKGAKTYFEGIHPTAVVHPTAKIGKGVSIGPYTSIDGHCVIGDHCTIHAHVSIAAHVQIGEGSQIYSHVSIREHSQLGKRVALQPGAVIGSCGFGYTQDAQGHHHKLEQVGSVVIEDDVEVGANTTIDRARFKETRIGRGSKLDNLVQIAHGASIGEDNCIISQVGIAGSSKTGKRVFIAGQSGVSGHVTISNDVLIAGRSGVTKSLKSGKYAGYPAQALDAHNKQTVHMKRLEKYAQKIRELEQKLQAIEDSTSSVQG